MLSFFNSLFAFDTFNSMETSSGLKDQEPEQILLEDDLIRL